MKIKVKNLGVLKQAEFELSDFTIICGENNTGKTYATYALFGFLSTWEGHFFVEIKNNEIEQLLNGNIVNIDVNPYIKEFQGLLEHISQSYSQTLSTIFATAEEKFEESSFQIIPEETKILDINKKSHRVGIKEAITFSNGVVFSLEKIENSNSITISLFGNKDFFEETIKPNFFNNNVVRFLRETFFSHIFLTPFIISSERTGAATFRKQLNFSHRRLLAKMSRSDDNIDLRELLSNAYEDYSLPIKTNLDFLENLGSIAKKNSFIVKYHPDILESFADLIGGKYTVTENDQLYYQPKNAKLKLTMDESSSAVRSLLDLGFYLRHVARPSDLLMIDEPELNLHPENQRRVARLLARLVNLGIKVFITTHSDYIVKELNTLIMLNHDKPHLKRIAEVEGYQQSELLKAEQIRVYIAEEAPVLLDGKKRKTKCQTLTPANIDPEMGIEARSFDKTIETMNRIQEDIVWGAD
jgi:ABC-type transport system involved in cytochrome c biogenesis ATPase subunit